MKAKRPRYPSEEKLEKIKIQISKKAKWYADAEVQLLSGCQTNENIFSHWCYGLAFLLKDENLEHSQICIYSLNVSESDTMTETTMVGFPHHQLMFKICRSFDGLKFAHSEFKDYGPIICVPHNLSWLKD
ncbi:hypothetical protein RF11_09376 [Thelohanellus kitauei]|uniref:Uncharacterized protein n=1 Tax=Thelohanellus kitauei TaxID=669202 RepID=A0A0C2JL81_THEKT|nr:hypothetical protein RF11_09376 [Thelohanellus kitauei]